MTHRWLLLLALLTACTSFDDLPRDVCGNGLVEPGEDCDADDPSCVRCAVACASSTDCPNADYRCGVDNLCHAPGGALAAPSSPVTFQADDLRITDLDRDGRGDVIGVSKTSIVVRRGNGAPIESFVTPAQSGPPSFGDLDGDGALDVTLATADGLVTYSSPYGTLSPVDIESPLYGDGGEPLTVLRLFEVGPQQLGIIFIENAVAIIAVVDFMKADGVYFAAPCALRLGALPAQRIAVGTLDVYRPAVDEQVVSFTTDTGQVCVQSLHGSPGQPYDFRDITPAGAALLAKRPVLIDLDSDADRCPGLLGSDAGPAALRYWDGELSSGRCTIAASATTVPALENSSASAIAIGRLPIQPAIPPFASDAIVMSSGVYAYAPAIAATVALYTSTRRLARVASGDLDRDGDIDAVLAPADEDDLDVLHRYTFGLELYRIDTAAPASSLTIGDFDGNGVNDVAFSEIGLGHHAMRIAYGTADRPLAPVTVATFSDITSVTPIQFRDSADQLGIALDLAVIQPGRGGGDTTATILHGSPQRTMISFFDPRLQDVGERTTLRSALVGRFMTTADDRTDLLAIASPHLDEQPTGMLAWRVAGTARGLDPTPSAGMPSDGVADCDLAQSATGVCVQDSLYFTWPDPGQRDVVFAIDRSPRVTARRLDPWTSPARLDASPLPLVTQGLPAGAVPRAMHAADLDGDGRPELIASFATRPGAAPTGSARVCTVGDGGIPTACEELAPIVQQIEPSIAACIDAAPGRITPRDRTTTPTPALDLVVLCTDGVQATSLYAIVSDATGRRATPLGLGAGMRAIRVGDVTGDGVDDVIAIHSDGGAPSLVVYAQCTSRDAARCRGTSP